MESEKEKKPVDLLGRVGKRNKVLIQIVKEKKKKGNCGGEAKVNGAQKVNVKRTSAQANRTITADNKAEM